MGKIKCLGFGLGHHLNWLCSETHVLEMEPGSTACKVNVLPISPAPGLFLGISCRSSRIWQLWDLQKEACFKNNLGLDIHSARGNGFLQFHILSCLSGTSWSVPFLCQWIRVESPGNGSAFLRVRGLSYPTKLGMRENTHWSQCGHWD